MSGNTCIYVLPIFFVIFAIILYKVIDFYQNIWYNYNRVVFDWS